MPPPSGFRWRQRGDEVHIFHRDRLATVLRGDAARAFVDELTGADDQDAQERMARVTGNYRRGNERTAKRHPRNA